MYVLHPHSLHSRLSPFYAVYIQTNWQLNKESIKYMAEICRNYSPEFQLPITRDLATIDRYINTRLACSVELTNQVVTELYQIRSTDRTHRLWVNFIHYMSVKVTSHMWNRLPEYKRINETLDLFRNAALVEPMKLFKSFDPNYDRDLLNGIERWTYRFLQNSISSQIRERDQFFRISNLGVVARSTKISIRKAISSHGPREIEETASHLQQDRQSLADYDFKDRLQIDLLLVDIYKQYLKQLQIRTDRLKANNWEQIHQEFQKKWSRLSQDLSPPSIDEIKQELDLIGSCVRKATSIPINSFGGDVALIRELIQLDVNSEDEVAWREAYVQLFVTIKETIATLDHRDVEILELSYRDRLIQKEIALKMKIDPASVSKKLTKIEKKILKAIHVTSCPDNRPTKIDRTAIRGMKIALRKFYSK
jgi:hypothetical protein